VSFDNAEQRRAALARIGLGQCGYEGCTFPRRSDRSKHCHQHYNRQRRTGHPNGKPILSRQLKPIDKIARQYIETNQEASPIAAGLRWAANWLLPAQHSGDDWQDMSYPQVRDTLIFKLERDGVEPVTILSRLATCHYLQAYEPRTILSDQHFEFQVGKLLLRLKPFPKLYERYDRVSGATRGTYLKPAPGVFRWAYKSIPLEAHILARNIAEKLHEPEVWKTKTLAPMKWALPTHNLQSQPESKK